MKKIIIFVIVIFIGLLGYGLYERNKISKQVRGIIQIDKQKSTYSQRCKEWLEGKEEFRFGCDPFYDLIDINGGKVVNSIINYTSNSGEKMTNIEALNVAKNSECDAAGEFTGESYLNTNSGGLVSLKMITDKKGCHVRCDVSIDNKTANIGWMCTGLNPSY